MVNICTVVTINTRKVKVTNYETITKSTGKKKQNKTKQNKKTRINKMKKTLYIYKINKLFYHKEPYKYDHF